MRRLPAAVAILALAGAVTACGQSNEPEPAASGGASAAAKPLEGVNIEVAAKWTGEEQTNFQKVLDAFQAKTGAKVTAVVANVARYHRRACPSKSSEMGDPDTWLSNAHSWPGPHPR